MVEKIRVTQIRKGKKVTFLTPDKGKPGKTPKDEQWYEPSEVESGWKKDMPEGERRRLVLKAHKGDELSSARSMQAKANVTTDRETKQKAKADAQYFFRRHKLLRPRPTPVGEIAERKPRPRVRERGARNLQQIHARRSPRAQAIDESQTHQVTIDVDSPKVKQWVKDPSTADIKGIDTPSARRRRTPRITPPTPKLRR